jgi:cell division septation protein DedD
VAASADLKDAEALAERLRHYGHEAYVMIARVEEKVWHRVRIGKFVTQYEAQELRKALTNGKEFRQAYVALN